MKKIIPIVLLSVCLVNIAFAQNIFEIDLEYNQGAITVDQIDVRPLQASESADNIEGWYDAHVISFSGETLNMSSFEIPIIAFFDIFDEETGAGITGEQIMLNEASVTIKVPYFENAEKITIYDYRQGTSTEIDVSEFSKKQVAQPDEPSQPTVQRQPNLEQARPVEQVPTIVIAMTFIFLLLLSILFWTKHHPPT